jgi:hypothetical protein
MTEDEHTDQPEQLGGAPAATDGQPDEDELERRRKARAGTSVNDRVETDSDGDGEPELFPLGQLAGDPKITLRNFIKPGATVEPSASMGTAAVPIKGRGFFDPEQEITLLVRVLPGGLVPVATRKKGDEKSKIEKWRVTQPLTPIYVEEAGEMYTKVALLEILEEAERTGIPEMIARLFPESEATTA